MAPKKAPPKKLPGALPLRATICAQCGVSTQVPFVPTPGRPVFCRGCFTR